MQVRYEMKGCFLCYLIDSESVADNYPRSYGSNRGRSGRPLLNPSGRFPATSHSSRMVREVDYPEEEEDDVLMG